MNTIKVIIKENTKIITVAPGVSTGPLGGPQGAPIWPPSN